MNVLVTTVPATGRLRVVLPLARGFADRGDRVVFAVAPALHDVVRAHGFEAIAAGADLAALRAESSQLRGFDSLPPDRQAFALFTHVAPRRARDDLLTILDASAPDLIVHEEGEHAAALVSAIRDVPRVTVGWPCPPTPAYLRERIAASLGALHREAGVAPTRACAWIHTHPLSLGQRVDDDGWEMRPVSATRIERAPGRTVHVTFGTVPAYTDDLRAFECCIDALSDAAIKLIVTTGSVAAAEILSERARGATVAAYLDHDRILPTCDAVVCHGGAGTCIAALAHGVPLLIVPRGGASQARNAAACERLGAGIALAYGELTVDRVRNAVARLLDDDRYRRAAAAIAEEIARLPSPEEVVRRLRGAIAERAEMRG